MPTLEVLTLINAPPERCFRLALSVDLHAISTRQTGETIVAGVRSGVLQPGDSVTFRARHFGLWQTLTSKVTEYEAPRYFCDEMQRGAFKRMRHEHHFEARGSGTLMRDVFEFASPLGFLGQAVDALVLRRYLRRFLVARGRMLKEYAETEAWRTVMPAG
ncbi:SRPBCC family protein [Hymenobacter rubripertinctus]|uniref:Cell division protein n=1 Tax=Hymenobacter rubripertinctus TaxID=2029981 RepID=A0A418QLA3_9BACT|nr:SRPBCC family protein [Hymenobacter rubripertinctus]RIY06026.1 cell division protein [Hymenobacter rubripertinctus]